jgi:hypothetical protein
MLPLDLLTFDLFFHLRVGTRIVQKLHRVRQILAKEVSEILALLQPTQSAQGQSGHSYLQTNSTMQDLSVYSTSLDSLRYINLGQTHALTPEKAASKVSLLNYFLLYCKTVDDT